MEKWYSEITIAELDDKNREIAEILGIDKYLELLEVYGGSRIYINKLEEVIKPVRDNRLRAEYNRYNIKELAKKYNLAEESVRRILKDEPCEGQIGLFDTEL